jgi:Sulfotransferase family
LMPCASVRSDVPQPIFVMGFPRSGTTLVEQVLASHSAVRPGGELTFVGEFRQLANLLFAGQEPFPENLGRLWTADNRHVAALFRDLYFARAEAGGLLGGDARFFTDKMPFNEIWLPLMRVAFPRAKVVHVVRHPLDVCVSIMANHLTHGFHCGYRIEDVVHHLAAVSDLTEHYRHEMGGETALDDHVLRYESFVADQRAETDRLLAYLDLPFEEGCLSFHENRRYARTPSYVQVTEKLNDRSIGRHRHYAAHLAPHLPALARLMATQGYGAARE